MSGQAFASDDSLQQLILRRAKKQELDKFKTPLYKLEEMFLTQQKARNNAMAT